MNQAGSAAPAVVFRALAPEIEEQVAEFFSDLAASGAAEHFHPHPFTRETAVELCRAERIDYYGVAWSQGRVVAYGMLRGWAAGFAIPSLGIAVRAAARGQGLGRALMLHLHQEAARRGAESIRLKVYPENQTAVGLYRSLGYVFEEGLTEGQLVGYVALARGDGPRVS